MDHSRARSIKTRIETRSWASNHQNKHDSRARSIKTRIETLERGRFQRPPVIREQDPLKQGLKPGDATAEIKLDDYSRARSIKTRIETR